MSYHTTRERNNATRITKRNNHAQINHNRCFNVCNRDNHVNDRARVNERVRYIVTTQHARM